MPLDGRPPAGLHPPPVPLVSARRTARRAGGGSQPRRRAPPPALPRTAASPRPPPPCAGWRAWGRVRNGCSPGGPTDAEPGDSAALAAPCAGRVPGSTITRTLASSALSPARGGMRPCRWAEMCMRRVCASCAGLPSIAGACGPPSNRAATVLEQRVVVAAGDKRAHRQRADAAAQAVLCMTRRWMRVRVCHPGC